MRWTLALAICMTFATSSAMNRSAVAQNQREQVVKQDKQKVSQDESWYYNDLDKAFAAARKENKPLLILVRCVP